MLQMMARPMDRDMPRLRRLIAVAALAVSASAAPALAQSAHQPFLQRDVPPSAWYYDGSDDDRDFQNNGFFPGDFAANPPHAWLGAAGIFGFTPSGGSHFGPIYCTRRYRSHNREPGYFQGDDGAWHRCQR
jgi:hypothetical protein